MCVDPCAFAASDGVYACRLCVRVRGCVRTSECMYTCLWVAECMCIVERFHSPSLLACTFTYILFLFHYNSFRAPNPEVAPHRLFLYPSLSLSLSMYIVYIELKNVMPRSPGALSSLFCSRYTSVPCLFLLF